MKTWVIANYNLIATDQFTVLLTNINFFIFAVFLRDVANIILTNRFKLHAFFCGWMLLQVNKPTRTSKRLSRIPIAFPTTKIIDMKYKLYHSNLYNKSLNNNRRSHQYCNEKQLTYWHQQLILDSQRNIFTRKTSDVTHSSSTKVHFQGLQLTIRGLSRTLSVSSTLRMTANIIKDLNSVERRTSGGTKPALI